MGKASLIVFPGAGSNRGLLERAARLLEKGRGVPVLLGRREDFLTTAEILGMDLRRARFIFPTDDPVTEDLVVYLRESGRFPGHTDGHLRAALLGDDSLYAVALAATGRADLAVLVEEPAGAAAVVVAGLPGSPKVWNLRDGEVPV